MGFRCTRERCRHGICLYVMVDYVMLIDREVRAILCRCMTTVGEDRSRGQSQTEP